MSRELRFSKSHLWPHLFLHLAMCTSLPPYSFVLYLRRFCCLPDRDCFTFLLFLHTCSQLFTGMGKLLKAMGKLLMGMFPKLDDVVLKDKGNASFLILFLFLELRTFKSTKKKTS